MPTVESSGDTPPQAPSPAAPSLDLEALAQKLDQMQAVRFAALEAELVKSFGVAQQNLNQQVQAVPDLVSQWLQKNIGSQGNPTPSSPNQPQNNAASPQSDGVSLVSLAELVRFADSSPTLQTLLGKFMGGGGSAARNQAWLQGLLRGAALGKTRAKAEALLSMSDELVKEGMLPPPKDAQPPSKLLDT